MTATNYNLRQAVALLRNGRASGDSGEVKFALNIIGLGWGTSRTAAQIPLAEENPFLIDLGFASPHVNIKGELNLNADNVNTITGDSVSSSSVYSYPDIYQLTQFCDRNRYNDDAIATRSGLNVASKIELEIRFKENRSWVWEGAVRTSQFDWDSVGKPGSIAFGISFITKFPRSVTRP